MRGSKVGCVCAVVMCALLLACTSRSSDSDAQVVLRSLDGASRTDTLAVSKILPRMPQQEQAIYHMRDNVRQTESKVISLADVLCPEYRIIPLETSEECLIGHVSDVVKDDSLLFVVDRWSKCIYAFDLNGKFLRRIGRKGHAEDEYVYMVRVAINKKNKRICVYDEDSQKLVFYDYQGVFLGRESLYFEFEHMAFDNDGRRVLLTLPYEHKDYKAMDSYRLTLTDGHGVPLLGILPNLGFPKYELDHVQFTAGLEQALHSTPDGVYYIDVLSPDTIWRVNEKECVPFLAADFGEPFSTPKTYREMTNDDYLERTNQVSYLHDDFVFTKDFGYLNTNFSERAVLNLKSGMCQRGGTT